MTSFWAFIFWALMLLWAVGGLGWWWGPPPQKVNYGVLWLLLLILGGYAIGFPGLPGR